MLKIPYEEKISQGLKNPVIKGRIYYFIAFLKF